MTIQLPRFNLTSVCPKCGMEGGGSCKPIPSSGPFPHIPPEPPEPFPTEYHKQSVVLASCPLDLPVEHLCRICPRCGFRWAEACKEASE